MTEDFKKKLFDYVTGNYSVESGLDRPYLRGPAKSIITDVYTLLNTMSSDYVITNKTTSPDGEFIIYYGYYATATKGFIAILNENFEVENLITTFDGGTILPALYFLTYDESGFFYGIGVDSSIKKLYLLNNFCIKSIGEDYKVIFRQSYVLDGDLQDALLLSIINVIKKNNSGKYLFIMPYIQGSGYITKVIVSTLEIVYGGTDIWIHNIYDINLLTTSTFLYGEWNIDNYNYKICAGGEQYVGVNGGSLTYKTLTLPFSGIEETVANSLANSYCSVNASTADFAIFKIYKIINGDTFEELFSLEDSKPATYATRLSLVLVNDIICFYFSYPYSTPGGFIFFIGQFGRILDDKAYNMGIYDVSGPFETPTFFLKRQFNKINYFLINDGSTIVESYLEIYNVNNYNGLDYQALNSMIPESSILYDDSDKIVFARNLYNKTISDSTTTSTIEVPNNYLNDVSISKEELASETNSILNSETTLIEKNIYEQLYINFINTLNVIDSNNTTQVLNLTGASRINDSISQKMDYDDTKIVKFVINYSDDTSDVRNFCIRTYSLTENRCTYTCIIYVPLDKNISNIQIKSNDEITTYLTINTSSLVGGKYYRLSQDLLVE